MKYFKSSIYGEIPQPQSFEELINFFLSEPEEGFNLVRYWRGQGDVNWRIDSSGYRRLLNTEEMNKKYIDDNLERYEIALLKQATHKGYRYQNGRELSDMELLAKLQLHGAATRLLDFSRNALIGLWFCVINNPSKMGLLIGVHAYYVLGGENNSEKKTYEKIIADCKQTGDIYTWEPPNVSTRTAAQHSQFLYSKYSDSNISSLMLPKEKNAVLLIAIDPEMKVKFKEILEKVFDLWTLTLYPDLDGFGMAHNFGLSRWDMDRW